MKVTVFGAGYVGLVTGLLVRERGHEVVFVDPDATRCARLVRGQVPFVEPDLGPLLERSLQAGDVTFTTDAGASAATDVALVCVPTPTNAEGRSDTSYLEAVARSLEAALREAPCALRGVLVRSTCVPGTTRSVFGRLARPDGTLLPVGTVPEFLREGSALADARSPDRLVVGAHDADLLDTARRLFGADGVPFVELPIEGAELAKLANNALLSTSISLSNELARIAEHLPGVDVTSVLEAVHLDRRLGGASPAGITAYLKAGAGFGGSCLVKDLTALGTFARDLGESPVLLDAALEINREQPVRLVRRLIASMGSLAGRRVLVLGTAFKVGTDDVRGSVALPVVDELLRAGASVEAHDPLAMATFQAALPADVRVEPVDDWRGAAARCEAVVVLTAWPEYAADLAPTLRRRTGPVTVADGRDVLRGAGPLGPHVTRLGVGLGPVESPGNAAEEPSP